MITRILLTALLVLTVFALSSAVYAEDSKPPAAAPAEPTLAPFAPQAPAASTLDTSLNYSGHLALADGSYDLQFSLYDAATGGALVGSPSTVVADNVAVKATAYTVKLNFGAAAFNGPARWLQIGWRPAASGGAFTPLSPRDQIRAVPYALGLRLPLAQTVVNNNGPGLFVINSGEGSYSFGLRGDSASNYGVAGISGSGFAGVYGSSSNNGVYGLVSSAASGVYGRNTGPGTGVTGLSVSGYGVSGSTTSGFAGVYGIGSRNGVFGDTGSNADSGVYGHNSAGGNGVAGISELGHGVYGRTNAGGKNGVFGLASNPDGSGVYGQNNGAGFGVAGRSASGIGVLGTSTAGFAMKADGNATQAVDKGGWVKAMLLIDESGNIVRCYNSQTTGANVSANGCGFKVTHGRIGGYAIDFGFPVNNRFLSATTRWDVADNGPTVAEVELDSSFPASRVDVITHYTNADYTNAAFYIFVY